MTSPFFSAVVGQDGPSRQTEQPAPMPNIDGGYFRRLVETQGAGSPHNLKLNTARPYYCTYCGEDLRPYWSGKPTACDSCLDRCGSHVKEQRVEQAVSSVPEPYRNHRLQSQELRRVLPTSQAMVIHDQLLGIVARPRSALLMGPGSTSLMAAYAMGILAQKPEYAHPSNLVWMDTRECVRQVQRQRDGTPPYFVAAAVRPFVVCLCEFGKETRLQRWNELLLEILESRFRFANKVTLISTELGWDEVQSNYNQELTQQFHDHFQCAQL